ncbi:GNAT family N-acetyltransferase [Hoeflea sp. WL0058]|uniref:GNAT family N-acetyltransferase n=1 Tax=Flavimaribacter sediminis TaxID=2865987 RepID=A0AAE2ZMY9_9HYPH|nr:GNAT family N-acetyltransferase [Flavimaribacter sediminis]MBW8637650.1 GNAT family N-acetyltransferase [Flavimaribacter sediminis]
MHFEIRDARVEDAEALHEILTSAHVMEGTMRLPVASLSSTRARITPRDGYIQLVALAGEELAAFSELVTHPGIARFSHVGEINMIVTHAEWRRKGAARTLMAAMIDLADNWLNLRRLYLTAFVDNPARALYEEMGFVVEGTMKDYAYRRGDYVDAHLMARLQTR